jgi:thiol:disulfide interchange protein
VVISVLLISANFYSQGNWAGLLLPFVLGTGMALPWPIAGAGLGLLPKPGAWMVWVKYSFGVLIIVFALYYGHLAYTLFQGESAMSLDAAGKKEGGNPSQQAAAQMAEQLERAQKEGKPVFMDFWATWCKNCTAMDETTFKDPTVQKELEGFVVIKYQAENPSAPEVKAMLDRMGVLGLPTYVVLTKKK